jgi:RIO kinase 1
MGKRTSYGRELIEESWRDMEYRALFDASHGGVRVPKPIMLYDDVLLMELVLDEDGAPASRLADFEIAPEDAEALHQEIYKQVRMLLGTGKVHGDLSAFNILMAVGGPTIIDMPQVVDAAQNNQAREILRRDLRNVTEHLARFDARLLRFRHCGDALWHHFQQGTLDQATRPQEGAVRGDRAGGGRRAALAQSGRMGRGDERRGGGHDRGPQGPRHDRPAQQGGPRHDRPVPQGGPRHDRPVPQGGPRHDRPAQNAAPHHDRPAHDREGLAMAPGRAKGRPQPAPVQVEYVRRSKPR